MRSRGGRDCGYYYARRSGTGGAQPPSINHGTTC
ncbi:MAG: hypothetical protein JWM36_2857 [Hyphomicrobiales bacterium]|nr:hypothetical protein [Hyphomicrobiales bacterium]